MIYRYEEVKGLVLADLKLNGKNKIPNMIGWLMKKTNLTEATVISYLQRLNSSGLILCDRENYEITEEGRKELAAYEYTIKNGRLMGW